MAARVCEQCGKEFTAQRSTARFCSPTCRVTWNRQKKSAAIVELPAPKAREHPGGSHTMAQRAALAALADVDDSEQSVEAATRAKFAELGVDMALPDVAVTLTVAKRVDRNLTETGAALKSLVAAWRESFDRVVGTVPAADDPLDEVKAKRDEILARASG